MKTACPKRRHHVEEDEDRSNTSRYRRLESEANTPSSSTSFVCPLCRQLFRSQTLLDAHAYVHNRPEEEYVHEYGRLMLTHVSMNGFARDYELHPTEPAVDIMPWLENNREIISQLFHRLSSSFILSARMVIKCKFLKLTTNDIEMATGDNIYISSLAADEVEDFIAWWERHLLAIKTNFNNFQGIGSNLIFVGIEHAYIKINLSENLNGEGKFKLPQKLLSMQAVINVDCDTACFKYAVLSILHYKDLNYHRNRKVKYDQWREELKFENLDVNNLSFKDIGKFEKLNNIKINIHVWENGLKGIRYNNKNFLAPQTVNLLLITNSNGERHYCGIPKLSRLYRHKLTSHNMYHICERCIRSFSSKKLLEEHFIWCAKGKLQIESMPSQKEFRYVSRGHELSPVKVIYADIECFINDDKIHEPAALAYYEVWHSHFQSHSNNSQVFSWIGSDCIQSFLNKLDLLVRQQYKRNVRLTRKPMKINEIEQRLFDSCENCPSCKTPFDDGKYRKVRDHDHITGAFRGPLCSCCNLQLRLKRRILPVIFHNFKNYDAHIIIKNGLDKMKDWELGVVAQSKEKFMTIRVRVPVDKNKEGGNIYFDIVFLDSYQFMSSSLDKLSSNLLQLNHTNKIKNKYSDVSDETIRHKGVFPYSYFNSLERLEETTLPSIDKFKNDLTGEECSNNDYRRAERAWTEFNCKNFKDYMLSYLELDVYLLADVFEEFRKVTLNEDGLDPVHFISLPGLTYMSAFKKTNEKIHLLQDAEMYSMFERGIRGGVTFVNRHKVTSQPSTPSNDKIILAYIDQNNLYGSALSKCLPHSEFRWADEDALTHFSDPSNILSLDDDGDQGYLFEVDLSYPSNLHDRTCDFPLAPESGSVSHEMFSPYMKELYKNLYDKDSTKYRPCRKLLLTQLNKENYIVHFSILKFYLEMGLVLTKVHRIIIFKQKRWLEPYIAYNSQRRQQARNSFEKDYYKLKNNSLFGKTMEDVRKRIQYKLVTDENKFIKLSKSPLFHDRDIITKDIVGVHMIKNKVLLDKAIFVGQAVLDHSKLEMYKLYYNTLKKCSLINKCELVGGDTDSFFLALHVNNNITMNDIFQRLSRYFDSSNYPQDHPLYSTTNKAVLGCFKDETSGCEIEEMILLKPKMYAMKLQQNNYIKRAKGISKSVVRDIKFSDYQTTFDEMKQSHVNMTIIKSRLHSIETVTFRKRALSAWEDKRCWLDVNHSLPHGHYGTGIPAPKKRKVMLPPSGDV